MGGSHSRPNPLTASLSHCTSSGLKFKCAAACQRLLIDHILGSYSGFFFVFVLGNVEFDLQNTAPSGPRACSVYIN